MLALLESEGFRNLVPDRLEFARGSHLFLGSNGVGKTSLLEAIYLLATTRSFRTSRVAECCRHTSKSFRIIGEIEDVRRTRLEVSWSRGGRRRLVNGSKSSLAEHLAVQPIVSWSSADASMLFGAPEERRRLIDRGLVGLYPAALTALSRYRKALSEKRQLLQSRGRELETWNAVLANASAKVIRMRAEYSSRLARQVQQVLEQCKFAFPEIRIEYRPSPPEGLEGEQAVADALGRAEKKEREFQRPLIGPHRDELVVRWGGHAIRGVASAGERKALSLAILAAQGEILHASGKNPIFLLDDFDTELDRNRLKALWRVFSRADQVFMSSNRPLAFDDLDVAHRWLVAEGGITLQ